MDFGIQIHVLLLKKMYFIKINIYRTTIFCKLFIDRRLFKKSKFSNSRYMRNVNKLSKFTFNLLNSRIEKINIKED